MKKKSVQIALLIACAALGCICWLIYAVFFHEEENILVDTCVAIDLSNLPAQPTERDWYNLSVKILKDNGWDLPTNVTGISYGAFIQCAANPTLYIKSIGFASSYFDGIIPKTKFAEIEFNWITGEASVVIRSKPLVWTKKSEGMDISRMSIDCYEAFKLADDFAGREFRNKVSDACEISLSIVDDWWSLGYKEAGKQWEDWSIEVNAITGEVERREGP